jgi:hypothetical protein
MLRNLLIDRFKLAYHGQIWLEAKKRYKFKTNWRPEGLRPTGRINLAERACAVRELA